MKQESEYTKYEQVPFYRRQWFNSIFVGLGLFIPFIILIPVYFILTGDIYENNYDKEGNLKKWSKGNRYAAIFLLLINIAGLVYLLIN